MANRIGEIQSQSNPKQWQYVETKESPADLCSRGLSRLKDNSLWWRGPDFLTKHESEWSKAKIKEGSEVKTEVKKMLTLTSSLNFVLPQRPQDRKWRPHPSNWSSWLRLTRLCAWVLRFIQNCRSSLQEHLSESLSPEEIENAEIPIIREAQQAAFTEVYHALQENKSSSKKSRLKTLVPLLDEDGLIRWDGRLRFAEFLPYDMRFPIILPRGSWTSRLRSKPHPCKLVHQILDTSSTRRNTRNGKMNATNVRDEKQELLNRSWLHCPLFDCDCHFEHLLESQLTMVALSLPSRVGENEEKNAGCVYSPA